MDVDDGGVVIFGIYGNFERLSNKFQLGRALNFSIGKVKKMEKIFLGL